jgi:hypothetical protein
MSQLERVQRVVDTVMSPGVATTNGDWGVGGEQLIAVRHRPTQKALTLQVYMVETLDDAELAEAVERACREADLIQ